MMKQKKFKLPNGFGSIVLRTDGNRRNPYEVRKTIDSRQKTLGFYPTFEEALTFLIDYNKSPSLFTPQLTMFSEAYALMCGERFKKLAKATVPNYKAVYKYFHKLYNKCFVGITIQDLQEAIHAMSSQGVKYASQKKCRHTYSTLLDNANANKTAIKRILGHSVQGITKGAYAHKDLHQLKKAIDLLR